jgi:hypothetical protein
MDNLPAHEVACVEQAIEAAKFKERWMPTHCIPQIYLDLHPLRDVVAVFHGGDAIRSGAGAEQLK